MSNKAYSDLFSLTLSACMAKSSLDEVWGLRFAEISSTAFDLRELHTLIPLACANVAAIPSSYCQNPLIRLVKIDIYVSQLHSLLLIG